MSKSNIRGCKFEGGNGEGIELTPLERMVHEMGGQVLRVVPLDGQAEQDAIIEYGDPRSLAASYRKALEEIAGRGCQDSYGDDKEVNNWCKTHQSNRETGDGWCGPCLAARALGKDHAEVMP